MSDAYNAGRAVPWLRQAGVLILILTGGFGGCDACKDSPSVIAPLGISGLPELVGGLPERRREQRNGDCGQRVNCDGNAIDVFANEGEESAGISRQKAEEKGSVFLGIVLAGIGCAYFLAYRKG